jgi:cytidine deaminase
MTEIKLESIIYEYQLDELDSAEKELITAANKASTQAYAPFSHFHVGAAVLLSNGQMITGSNQENAAYPSGICAERTALFASGHQFPNEAVTTIAIAANSEDHDVSQPVTPCGACLQVISESERRANKPIRILLYGQAGKVYVCQGVKTLMPLVFKLDK